MDAPILTPPRPNQRQVMLRLWRLAAVVVFLALPFGGQPAAADPAASPAAGEGSSVIYLPIAWNGTFRAAELANPSFEANTYVDWNLPTPCYYENGPEDPYNAGNQPPEGWNFSSPGPGEKMPFKKWVNGELVDAISEGRGEYKHLCFYQLPKSEYPGAFRALVLDGWWTYKAFSDHLAWALVLSQELTGTVGYTATVSGYIVGETSDRPSDNNTELSADHFIASVQLGDAEDTRIYATMKEIHDIGGNERAWNRFVVTNTFPYSGTLTLRVIVQANWTGNTDFFMDDFRLEQQRP